MSGTAKSLLAAALALPLVAFVAFVLATPDAPEPDRSRPVIIGNVSDDEPSPAPERPQGPTRPGPDDRQRGDRDEVDDGPDQAPPQPPDPVVTPQPRDLDDDDDRVGDDDDDDDDETDDDDGDD